MLERVRDEIVHELRRRLGGPFTLGRADAAVSRAGHRLVLCDRHPGGAQHTRGVGPDDGRGRRVRALRARGQRLRRRPPHRGPQPLILVVVRVLAAGAADHDLVLLDRDLDRPVAGPVLGVDRVVLDGRVEPQAVALIAVVEGRLERARRTCAVRRPLRPPRRPRRRRAGRSSSSSSDSSSSSGRSASAASSSAAISASSSARRSISSSKSTARPALGVGAGLETLLALEGLNLLDGDLELVRDPGVGSALAHPGADAIELWS